jgi:uncharacterized protein (TIGR03435 family)
MDLMAGRGAHHGAAAILVMALALQGAAQRPPSTEPPITPSFEIASVKPNASGLPGQSSQTGKGSVTTINMRVRALLVLAYGARPEQIDGLPAWTDEERFDIAARAPANTPDNQLRLMLRTLLSERFRLVVRTERRERPVYALVVARADGRLGPNLKPSAECDAGAISTLGARTGDAAVPVGKRPCTVITGSNGKEAYITGGARSVEELVRALQLVVTDRPVVNRTGLVATYDFDLRFSAAPLATPPTPALDYPSIFAAAPEQLGLRLESTRGAVEFLVVERIERPTPD